MSIEKTTLLKYNSCTKATDSLQHSITPASQGQMGGGVSDEKQQARNLTGTMLWCHNCEGQKERGMKATFVPE